MTIRVAIYLRQSKDKEDNKLAITRQREACLKLCADKDDWTDITEYVDNDRSASNGKPREAYLKMLDDMQAGKVDAVVAYHQDRLHRDVVELIAFGAIALQHDVLLTTVAGGDIDLESDDGEFMAIIGAAVARKEVRRKSARQKLAALQKAESGEWWWSARPFGFAYDAGDPNAKPPVPSRPILDAEGKPTLDPVEAAAIRQAYEDLLAGNSLRSIAGDLDAAGLRTPRGNRWKTSSQVRQLLESPRNAGLRSYNGDEELRDAAWPAIVPRDVWELGVAILSDESRLCGTSRARKHLLSNLVICGGMLDAEGKPTKDPALIVRPCGARMGSGISGRGKTIYVCRNCNGVSRDGASLDDLVSDAVVARLSREDAVELIKPESRADLDGLRSEARALRARLNALAVDFADGDLTTGQLKIATARITERLGGVESALSAAQTAHAYDSLIGIDDVRGAFLDLHLDKRRAVTSELLKITVLPTVRGARFRREDVRIEFTEGTEDPPDR